MLKRVVVLGLFSLFFLLVLEFQAEAASLSVAVGIPAESVDEGSLISLSGENYFLSNVPYDSNIIGVITKKPVIALVDKGSENDALLVTSGEVLVRVNGLGGSIGIGDYITSSAIPGVGQKAEASGKVIGTALEVYSPANPSDTGVILVSIDTKQFRVADDLKQGFMNLIRSGLSAPYITPLMSLRYILSSLVLLVAFSGGLYYFGKFASNGISAMGRNPLAKDAILKSINISFLITAVMIFAGLGLAFLILSL